MGMVTNCINISTPLVSVCIRDRLSRGFVLEAVWLCKPLALLWIIMNVLKYREWCMGWSGELLIRSQEYHCGVYFTRGRATKEMYITITVQRVQEHFVTTVHALLHFLHIIMNAKSTITRIRSTLTKKGLATLQPVEWRGTSSYWNGHTVANTTCIHFKYGTMNNRYMPNSKPMKIGKT